MIEQEREISAETIKFKALRLITQTYAEKMGISSEVPLFISLATLENHKCSQCDITYGPLIYFPDLEVQPHHFHKGKKGGGVYFIECPTGDEVYFMTLNPHRNTGWFAEVKPIENVLPTAFAMFRAKRLRVGRMRAYCTADNCINKVPHYKPEISEGFVILSPEGQFLLPICSLDRHPRFNDKVQLTFKITDTGEVFFSAI